jgi:murein DD-endopeptidase MepM/ murein hydrolase activator NlpD
MRRRSHLAAFMVAILAVVWLVGGAQPHSTALAGDPIADAKAQQQALNAELARQRAQLAQLKATAALLSQALDDAKTQLKSVSAQYDRVSSLLAQVRQQVADVQDQLAELNHQIATLDTQLKQIAADIVEQTQELAEREALLQDHLRSAYEQSQTSLLEVLLSANSLDDATNQVGYLLSVSDQDKALADDIRTLREELQIKQQELKDGRVTLGQARLLAQAQEKQLVAKRAQLASLQTELAALKKEWLRQEAARQAALNASLRAQKNLQQEIGRIQAAAAAQAALVKKLQAAQTAGSMIGPGGFRWPETGFQITQYFGPTSLTLEPPYTYNGVYYAHFHTGIDISAGCGTPIVAGATGIVAASGQPLYPYDTGFGVIINHGAGIQSWYWHMQPRVVVQPGQTVTRGQLIGYEGSTGFATGCHVHFAINVNGGWRDPMGFLP